MTARRGRPPNNPERAQSIEEGLGRQHVQGMRKAKGERREPLQKGAKKAGEAKELGLGACAYRATSVDMKDKKRIASPKAFLNPIGFTHRQEGTFNIPGPDPRDH